jgi:hypothetical protein
MTRSRCNRYLRAGAVLWVSAACGGPRQPPSVTPGQAGAAPPSAAPPSAAPAEHGMDAKPATSGAPSDASSTPRSNPSPGAAPEASLVIEAKLRARRIQNGRSITFDDVRSGDRVMDGDRLQLSVRASQDAYLYLAFCSQHAGDPRHPGLSVFPEIGGIRMVANEAVTVPARTEIILDDKAGRETLYLILSRAELARADSGLAGVIAAARQGRETVDCGAPLPSALAGPHKRNDLRRGRSGGGRGSADSTPSPAAGRARPPVRAANTKVDRPVVEIERGGEIVLQEGTQSGVEADLDGIVVLRYELEHTPAPLAHGQSPAPASH